MGLSENKINLIKNYFKDKPVQKAYLFGSTVTEKTTSESDIDFLVELDYSKPIGLYFVTMQYKLQELLRQKVDLLSEKAILKYIRPHIENQKRLIYERQ
ncbi:nucleotidyltransferase domain-containing protein [bacterium]|nr:nucleotidyltransferase domain-containing protein [bacterium]RQV99314.1 MAG: nucleotidyltransferase [bacterium]